jgi:hypothetical protein
MPALRLNEEFWMYHSPPSAQVWTRRQWIAAIGTGLLGAAISLGLISLARGDIESGLRGIVMAAFQCLINVGISRQIRPGLPARAKKQRWTIIILSVIVVLAAGKIGLDLIQDRPMGPVFSAGLGAGATIFGPLWIWGRHRERIQRGG